MGVPVGVGRGMYVLIDALAWCSPFRRVIRVGVGLAWCGVLHHAAAAATPPPLHIYVCPLYSSLSSAI